MKFTSQLILWFADRPKTVACAAALITAIALLGLPSLEIDDNFNNLLRQSTSAERGLELESDDNTCLLLVEGDRLLEPTELELLRELVIGLAELPQVEAVHSIFDARKPVRFGRYYLPLMSQRSNAEDSAGLRQQALEHPVIAGKLLSTDARTTLVLIELNPELQRASETMLVLQQVRELADTTLRSSGLTISMTGIPALQVEMTESLKWEQVVFISGAEVVGLLISFRVFRSLAGVLIVQSGPMLAVIWSLGLMAILGEPLNVINCVLAPLVLTIALTDSVHLLLRIRTTRAQGESRSAAVRQALRHVGPACLLTSLTTAIAFGSLVAADIEVIRRFGWTCAMSVIAAFLAVITIVPLLAATPLGDFLVGRSQTGKGNWTFAWVAWLDQFVTRGRTAICITAIVGTLGLLAVSTRLQPDIQMQQFLPSYGPALEALRKCDRLFGGSLPVYIIVSWDQSTQQSELLEALSELESIVEGDQRLSPPISIISLLRSLTPASTTASDGNFVPESIAALRYLPTDKLQRLLRLPDRQTVVISRIPDVGTRHVLPIYKDLKSEFQQLEQRWPSLQFRMSGWTVSAGQLSRSMLGDMMTSLYIAVLISFLILVAAFRSLHLGLISLVPNLFPLVATSATMVLLDLPLHFSSATVFSVCFGIAVDDTIHFLSSYVQQIESGAKRGIAIRHTLRRVGEALVASTIIMVCAFGVVVFSRVPSIHEFALIFIVVLGWALLADLLFLPALLGYQFRQRSSGR